LIFGIALQPASSLFGLVKLQGQAPKRIRQVQEVKERTRGCYGK
jgi:hypothetical protein